MQIFYWLYLNWLRLFMLYIETRLLYNCKYKVKGGKTTMKDHEVEAGKILRKYILLLLELEGIIREYFIKIYLFVF